MTVGVIGSAIFAGIGLPPPGLKGGDASPRPAMHCVPYSTIWKFSRSFTRARPVR